VFASSDVRRYWLFTSPLNIEESSNIADDIRCAVDFAKRPGWPAPGAPENGSQAAPDDRCSREEESELPA